MKVDDIFNIKGRQGRALTTKQSEIDKFGKPVYVGDLFTLGEKRWRLSGVEHVRYSHVFPPPEERSVGLFITQCEGTVLAGSR